MQDEVDMQLAALEASLERCAEKAGEGPKTMSKSKFQSTMDKEMFVAAFGQAAYDNLKE